MTSPSHSESKQELPPIQVPASALSEDALLGVMHDFIVREGTDYGTTEVSFETKVAQIRKQIQQGHVVITFDPNTESVSLLTKLDWLKRHPDAGI
jgi:uncharacterized protein YheU (UPF0270 family)